MNMSKAQDVADVKVPKAAGANARTVAEVITKSGELKDKPVAVIGAALGRYGGAWAHDETRKSLGIAGPRVVDSITLSLPISAFDGKHPRDTADVVDAVREAVSTLAAEVG